MTTFVGAQCRWCGIAIDRRRTFPLWLSCHVEARGIFCLRCYERVAAEHVTHGIPEEEA